MVQPYVTNPAFLAPTFVFLNPNLATSMLEWFFSWLGIFNFRTGPTGKKKCIIAGTPPYFGKARLPVVQKWSTPKIWWFIIIFHMNLMCFSTNIIVFMYIQFSVKLISNQFLPILDINHCVPLLYAIYIAFIFHDIALNPMIWHYIP